MKCNYKVHTFVYTMEIVIKSLPPHSALNLRQSSNDLLIVMPPSNDLQADRRILISLRRVHVIDELIFCILRFIVQVLLILPRVDRCDGEYDAGVVE